MNYTVTEGNYLKFGLQEVKDGVIFTFAGEKEDVCAVILYDRSLHVADRVEAPAAFCRGAVRSICIQGLKTKNLFYNYEINGEVITDAYAKKIAGREKWNDVKRADKEYLICGSFEESAYEWQSAGCPEIPKKRNVHVQASCPWFFHGFREKREDARHIFGGGRPDSILKSTWSDNGGVYAAL